MSLNRFFEDCRSNNRPPLIGYLPAGYPDGAGFAQIVEALGSAGLRILELGVPEQTPFLDGEIIQDAMRSVTESGIDPLACLAGSGEATRRAGIIPVAMMYRSTFRRYGAGTTVEFCVSAGAAGILIPDLVEADRAELRPLCDAAGLQTVGFVPADCSDRDEIRKILEWTDGFVYLQAYTGSTGEPTVFAPDLKSRILKIRGEARRYGLSVALGFGIQTEQDAEIAVRYGADAVITGTALVRASMDGPEAAARFIGQFSRFLG